MKKKAVVFITALMLFFCGAVSYGDDYEKMEIRAGMTEKEVNERYGSPASVEDMKRGFLFVPRKKALYKIDETDHMILHFTAGRVKNITILSDMNSEDAAMMFKRQ
ncbi:MAG: hypothetical protein ABH883_01165 [Candidatus Omnitrophota bacterium]